MAERILADRYRIVRHLARGGMAEVLLGHDELLGRTVAVKVLTPELAASDPSFVERFRREARSAAALNHHNIVSVFDFGEDAGSHYIVMEYVDGETLRDVIRRQGPMEPAEAVRIATAVASGLAAAHAQGMVHRDVKPANVLIADGAVKVADFGIARAAATDQGLTQPGMVLGTARYLSPEQARGAPVDARSDIYSLGMVLYEMLAGGPPFPGRSPLEVATRQLRETPPPPSSHNPRVPPALDAVVARAMSLDPSARYQSAEDLRVTLAALASDPQDPDATVALAGPDATRVAAAGPATAVLPPVGPAPDEGGLGAAPLGRQRSEDQAYRRRRAVVIGVVVALIFGMVLVLSQLGDSGRATVPEVTGLSVADATSALEGAGLDARVVQQDRPGVPGQVLDQDPKAGVEVDRGSTVSLFVAGAAATTTAPAAPTTAPTRVTTTTASAPTTTAVQAPATTSPAPTTTVLTPTTATPPTTRSSTTS